MLTISVPSRIHITLIDLGSLGYRRNGGIGFCINQPSISVSFELSPKSNLSALSNCGFSLSDIVNFEKKIANLCAKYGGKGIALLSCAIPERHTGLGVGTGLAMSLVEAFFLLNKIQFEYRDVVIESGRGGTSGIGVNTYFHGGFVFDIGRRFDLAPLMSSDEIESPVGLPCVLAKASMPKWNFGLLRNLNYPKATCEQERALFSDSLPLSNEDVFRTAYHAVFGTLGSIVEEDFNAFCASINELQECSWKNSEIEIYGKRVREDIKKLKDLGCDAVGMSSVGPTLFFLAADFENVFSRVKIEFSDALLLSVEPNNFGREIIYA